MARRKSLEAKQKISGYLFTLPFAIGSIVFVIFPMICAVIFSFATLKNGSGFLGNDYSNWGLVNFSEIWMETTSFREAILSSLSEMLYNVPVVVIFAFFMASVLNQKFKGRGFFRSVMFLPVIISAGLILSLSGDGLIASIVSSGDRFSETGSGSAIQVTDMFQTMLEDMNVADWMVKLIVNSVANISNIVSMSAISIVIFIAGLQSISPSIYEASYMEGATKWETFWKISLPMVSPLILLSVVYTIVDNFNGSNNQVIAQIHDKVNKVAFVTASAMGVSYSLIIITILVIVFAILNKVVFYQD